MNNDFLDMPVPIEKIKEVNNEYDLDFSENGNLTWGSLYLLRLLDLACDDPVTSLVTQTAIDAGVFDKESAEDME